MKKRFKNLIAFIFGAGLTVPCLRPIWDWWTYYYSTPQGDIVMGGGIVPGVLLFGLIWLWVFVVGYMLTD